MARKMLTGADLSGQKITNLADGTAAADAVTKAQLDAIARGLDWKNSVRAATTANITLSGTQTIDSIALAVGDRVLVKDQTTASANGVYVVASGAWTRATDYDDGVEVTAASAIPVESGTANGDAVFILATDGAITIGTTSLSFTRLGGSGVSYTAGNGLTLSGSQFAVLLDTGSGLVVAGTGLKIDPSQFPALGLARKLSFAIPAATAGTPQNLTHNFNTLDVQVEIIEVSTGAIVEPDIVANGVNTISVTFAAAISAGQYRAVVIG